MQKQNDGNNSFQGPKWLPPIAFIAIGLIGYVGFFMLRGNYLDALTMPLLVGFVWLAGMKQKLALAVALVAVYIMMAVPAMAAGLMLVSATCGTCRALIADMYRSYNMNVTILLTGNDELADSLASITPKGITVIRDPLAHQIAASLQIQSTPFAVIISDGQIQNKSYLFSHQTLVNLTQNRIPLELA